MKKEPNRRRSVEDVCDVTAPTLVSANSGGPIQIDSMRQSPVGSNKIRITFAVNNVGGGLVYPPGTFSDSCSGFEREMDQLKISVKNPQSNFVVSCSQFGGSDTGVLRLVNNRKELSCTIDTSGMQEATFQDIVHLVVDYTYREAVTTSLVVENSM